MVDMVMGFLWRVAGSAARAVIAVPFEIDELVEEVAGHLRLHLQRVVALSHIQGDRHHEHHGAWTAMLAYHGADIEVRRKAQRMSLGVRILEGLAYPCT